MGMKKEIEGAVLAGMSSVSFDTIDQRDKALDDMQRAVSDLMLWQEKRLIAIRHWLRVAERDELWTYVNAAQNIVDEMLGE